MALTTYTLTGDFADLIGGDINPRTIRATLETNLPKSTALVDKAGKRILLGAKPLSLDAAGVFSLPGVVATNSADTNVLDESLRYRVTAQYVDPVGPTNRMGSWTSGWFQLTANTNLADVVGEEFIAPAVATVLYDQTVAAKEAAEAAAAAAVAPTATQLAAVDADPASTFRQQQDARLSATFGAVVLVTDERFGGLAGGSATLQAIYDFLEPTGGAIGFPNGVHLDIATDVFMPSAGVSLVGLGGSIGGLGRIFIGGELSAQVDFSSTVIDGVIFDNADPNSLTDECLVIRNARSLKVRGNVFRNLGKAIVVTTEHGATGFHTVGMVEVRDNFFTAVDFGVYADTVEWDVCSDWTIAGNVFNRAADTSVWMTGTASGRSGGTDGLKLIDNVFFSLASPNFANPLFARKRHNVYIGKSNFTIIHGNNFFEAGLSAIRLDNPQSLNIQGNHFPWAGQRERGDCIEIRGGVPHGVISGNTFDYWTRNAIGFYDEAATQECLIAQNIYKWAANTIHWKGSGSVDNSNCFRIFSDTSCTGRPMVQDFAFFSGGIFDSLGSSNRITARDYKSTWGGLSAATRRSVNFTAGVFQDVFLMSNFIEENVYAGLLHVTARPSDTSGKVASYVINIAGGGGTTPVTATVSAVGQTGGAAANDPSFTFAATAHALRATPVGSTAGPFFFDVVAIGSAAPR